MLNKTSCPFGGCTLSVTAAADVDVPLCLWLKGNGTLGGCLSYSWGSLQFTVDSHLHSELEDLLVTQVQVALTVHHRLRWEAGTSPSEPLFKGNKTINCNRQSCIISAILTFWIYCRLSALHFLSWRSPSSMNLFLVTFSLYRWHHTHWRHGAGCILWSNHLLNKSCWLNDKVKGEMGWYCATQIK